jgi:hypothetical protein
MCLYLSYAAIHFEDKEVYQARLLFRNWWGKVSLKAIKGVKILYREFTIESAGFWSTAAWSGNKYSDVGVCFACCHFTLRCQVSIYLVIKKGFVKKETG